MSRRWVVFGHSNATRNYTAQHDANPKRNKTQKKNRRPYDESRDPILNRAGSTSSDADYVDLCVEEELVNLTFVYPKHDIEMLSDAVLGRLPPAVRRNMIQYPQTDPKILYEQGPPTAPPPRIPDPSDDAPQLGYREKYLKRIKKPPAPEHAATGKNSTNSKKRKVQVDPISEGEKRARARTRSNTPPQDEQIQTTVDDNVAVPTGHRNASPSKAISDEVMQSIEVDYETDERHRVLLLQGQPPSPRASAELMPSTSPNINTQEPVIPDPGPPNLKEVGFLGLPQLVRRQIYRHLLLSPERIYVHAS